MSNIVAVTMPKWGMEMTEGTINEWHSQEGETVAMGAELIDVETSKIVNTVEAGSDGVLRKQIAQPGEVLPCGALLAVIADAGVSDADIEQFIHSFSADASGAQTAKSTVTVQTSSRTSTATKVENTIPSGEEEVFSPLSDGPDDSQVAASSIARRLAKKLNVNLNNVRGTGKNGRISKEDVEQAVANAVPVASGAPNATPVAKRLAAKHGIDLASVTATGKRGRISKEDVELAIAAKTELPSADASLTIDEATYTAIPLNGMKKTIASRLSESKQTAPHFRLTIDINLEALLAARTQINLGKESEQKISVNDFVIKACAQSLKTWPDVNVQYSDNEIRQFPHADISMAVAVEGGLITPVIRSADTKTLSEIAADAKDLAQRAKENRLQLDEFQGGTFSISNLGMFGVRQFDAVINLPQAAILAVSAAEKRAIVVSDELAMATMMTVTLSCDHRAIDGALGAQFLSTLKSYLEKPMTMLV